jgi:hypothetical protein
MPKPSDRVLASFAPRVTIMLIAGFVIFLVAAGLYVLPVYLEPLPLGAIADYREQRIIARLDGKVLWILIPSFVVSALLGARGWLPGTGRQND